MGVFDPIVNLFKRSTTAAPYKPRLIGPSKPGAYLLTFRSVPRHHDGIEAAITSTGSATVFFSEPLAYLRGQGVSLFRVEATGFDWLPNLYSFWRETQAREAFNFEIALYFNNIDFVASLSDHTPESLRQIIEQSAPRTPDAPREGWRTPHLNPNVEAGAESRLPDIRVDSAR